MSLSYKELVAIALTEWETVRFELSHVARSDLSTFTGSQLRKAAETAGNALLAMHFFQRLLCQFAGLPFRLPEVSDGQWGLSKEKNELIEFILSQLPPVDAGEGMTRAQVDELSRILDPEPTKQESPEILGETQWLRFLSVDELKKEG